MKKGLEILIRQLQRVLRRRSKDTKTITSLMNNIAVVTGRPVPEGQVNPLDFADDVMIAVLSPSVKFIEAGGQLVMNEDHQAHRHEYTIKLIVDYNK